MSDFSMCYGDNCRLKLTCKRFTDKPSAHRQAYLLPAVCENGYMCQNYLIDQDAEDKLTRVKRKKVKLKQEELF